MKQGSRKARRMGRHHKLRKAAPLSLVSLMDIFTILVFFLLVNSSSVPQLPSSKDLTLPISTAKKLPGETLVMAITPQSLLVQGREVALISELIGSEQNIIPSLKEELEYQKAGKQLSAEEQEQGLPITIIGDENIPYELIDKILATCQQVNYTEIAFAAQQRLKPKDQ